MQARLTQLSGAAQAERLASLFVRCAVPGLALLTAAVLAALAIQTLIPKEAIPGAPGLVALLGTCVWLLAFGFWLGSRLERGRQAPLLRQHARAERLALAANTGLLAMTERAEKSERQLLAVTNHLPALIAFVGPDEVLRFANSKLHEVAGISEPHLVGMSLRTVLGEATYRRVQEQVDTALAGYRTQFDCVLEIGGVRRYLDSTFIPQRNADGAVTGFYCMSLDITARKQAELERLRLDERLRTIADNLPAAVVYLDRQRRFQFINQTWEDWLAMSRSEILGHRWAAVLGDAATEEMERALTAAFAGTATQFDSTLATNGGTRVLQGALIPHLDDDCNVQGVYGMLQDVTAFKAIELELSRMARHDALTGLPNRYLFNETLNRAIDRARRDGGHVGLIYLDIDHFKSINDQHGHAAGDALLRELGARLAASVRRTDTAARLAGDEFAVILEGLREPAEAGTVAAKILDALTPEFDLTGHTLTVTASLGVALLQGTESAVQFLQRADNALYQAKGAGRNRYSLADQAER